MRNYTEEDIIYLFTKKQKFNFQNDDCEIQPTPKNKIPIITCDSMIENTHFRLEWHSPEKLAKKLFHINLSDMISSGGLPEWCILQMGIPKKISKDFLIQFSRAFLKECKKYQCFLIGGDTFHSTLFTLSLTMGGSTKRYISRKSLPGAYVYVTGNLGLSQLGLDILNRKKNVPEKVVKMALKKHLEPQAKVKWAKQLYPYVISMMDISDGIVQDVIKMAKATGYQFHIELDKIPIFSHTEIDPFYAAMSGEEYELLFTSKKEVKLDFVKKIGFVSNIKLNKRIKPVIFSYQQKIVDPPLGFLHF